MFVFWKAKSDEILLLFFSFICFHVLFKSWAQNISHKGEKKLDTRGRCSPHHKNVMFCDRVPLPVRAGRQRKKICQNKQSQIILILLLLFFFKCWWTRVINTGFLFFNVVEAGEKQQHNYIQTIILLQLLTFFSSCSFLDLFPTSFFGPYKLNFGMEHHIKFISILTVRVLFDLINVL